jgi:hypothetical protein
MKRSAADFTKGFLKPHIDLLKQPKKSAIDKVPEKVVKVVEVVADKISDKVADKISDEIVEVAKVTEIHIDLPKNNTLTKDSNFCYDSLRDDSFFAIQKYCKAVKPLMIVGPPGCGKTYLVQHYSDAEFYDDQDVLDFVSLIGLRRRGPCVFDPIEGLDHEKKIIKKVLENHEKYRPIILIGEDKFSEPLKSWVKYCNVVNLEIPSKQFLKQVLSKHHSDKAIIDSIVEHCRGNLGSAIQSLKIQTFSDADAPLDVFKAARLMTQGLKVQCLGGSSDASFLTTLMQLNSFQVCKDSLMLSKKMELFSILDILESRHILDGESTWDILSSIGGPQTSTWKFEWPKSVAPKKDPWYK